MDDTGGPVAMSAEKGTQGPLARAAAGDWRVVAGVLLAPVAFSTVRKLVPGQPSFLEIGGVFAVAGAGVWLLTRRRMPPQWVTVPLLVWAYFQLVYAALAMQVDWRVGVLSTMTRIMPLLMAAVAYAGIRTLKDFDRIGRWATGVIIVMLPIALLAALFGNEALPEWLRPIEALGGKTVRGGFPAVAGIFSTQHVMGLSLLAIFFLALSNAAIAESVRRPSTRWLAAAAGALLLVYLSTRRAALMAAFVGLVVFVATRRRAAAVIIAVVGLVGVAVLLDQYGSSAEWATGGFDRRTQLILAWDMRERLVGIFGRLFWLWLQEMPMGTFLGFAGPETTALVGKRLYARTFTSVEVGGAQLLAETGLIGALLLPVVVVVLAGQAFIRSRGLRCHRAITMLVLFQATFFGIYYLKELTAMTGGSLAHLFFWAVPGIAAALIEREKRERRQLKALRAAARGRLRPAAGAPLP